ncbi:YkyA family protein [Bacillus atrophaeus]|uniref:YkyA family protein n=1 Tax=Bacillus atrophaeus TaxID=1452 RepID=UPI001FC8F59D|nr:YkyA family protein [Bacillus atrophaeus]
MSRLGDFSVKFNKKHIFAGICALGASSVLLTGCAEQDPVESLHDSLEKVVQLEKPFQKEQKTLEKLEKDENKLYDSVIQLNMDDYKKIVSLSNQALDNASKREEHLKTEKSSIDDSKKVFKTAKESAEDIKDEKIKEKAENAASYMEKRYSSYSSMYKEYEKAIKLDKKLYKLMKKKDLTLDDLDQQIDKVNTSYDKVLKQSEEFNKQTEKYNQAREELYNTAGFDVKKS